MKNFTLRPYQASSIQKGIDFFESNKKLAPSIIVGPVAAGKSIIIGQTTASLKTPTLVIQPSKELLEQNYDKLIKFGGQASIFSASVGKKEIGKCTYATLGSIKNRVEDFIKVGVENVIIDECHFGYPADKKSMFRKFMDKLKPKKVLGYTATPIRLTTEANYEGNNSKLKMLMNTNPSYFKNILDVIPISLMVEKEYWSKLIYELHGFDESNLRLNSTGSEYTEGSIRKAIKIQNIAQSIRDRVGELLKEGRKNILVFTESVETAIYLADCFKNAAAVHGKLKKKERSSIVERFKTGDIEVCFNFGVLTTGFDHPELDTVILGRPTNSLALYYQKVGRGTRIHDNKKDCLIIDYCNNVRRFGKLETLNFKNISGYGWGMFTDDDLLTGIPMGTKVSLKEIEESLKQQEADMKNFTMKFGKYKGRLLSEIPLQYRDWMLQNISIFDFSPINNDTIKLQLIKLKDTNIQVPNDQSKVILVDFNNIVHSLYKRKILSSEKFSIYLNELKREFNTTNIKVICDSTRDTYWRKEILPEYKAHRKAFDYEEDFYNGIKEIKENYDIIIEPTLESDDIIARIVRSDEYMEVFVVSSDSDFSQLAIFNKFCQYHPFKRKKLEITKKQAFGMLLTKILKGDSSDNISKSHKAGRIMTTALNESMDKAYKMLIEEVKSKNIRKLENLDLENILWYILTNDYDMDMVKFKRNFKLINLMQDMRAKKEAKLPEIIL